MKLRNKKTGEIAEWDFGNWYQYILNPDNKESYECTLSEFIDRTAKFREEWEDVPEEPKYWRITDLGEIKSIRLDQHHQNIEKCKEIGNYFETKEEAELAVRKLKAWKRLEDKGFRFEWWKEADNRFQYNTIAFNSFVYNYEDREQLRKDLDLLFSGGEE